MTCIEVPSFGYKEYELTDYNNNPITVRIYREDASGCISINCKNKYENGTVKLRATPEVHARIINALRSSVIIDLTNKILALGATKVISVKEIGQYMNDINFEVKYIKE